MLSVTPYYNRPEPPRAHRALQRDRRGHRQADPALQHPAAHGARHPQRPARRARRRSTTSSASSRPTTTTSRPIDGLDLYAGNDDILARTLDMGGAGGILRRQPHRRRRDAPDGRRARAPRRDRRRRCSDVYAAMGVTTNPDPRQGRAEPARPRRRRPAAAARRGRRGASRASIRAALERHGAAEPRSSMSRQQAARPAARRPGRDRQEHDGRRVRRTGSSSSTPGCASRRPR